MTYEQIKKYRAEWAKCWIAIVRASGGQTTAIEDDVRAAITVKAIGRYKSSAAFSNDEFDHVLAVVWAFAHADNLDLQLRQIDQPLTRAEGSVYAQALLSAIGIEPHGREAYLGGICRRIFKKGLAPLTDDEWPTILAALNHTRLHKEGIAHNHPRTGRGRSQWGHRVGHRSAGQKMASTPEAAPNRDLPLPVEGENPF